MYRLQNILQRNVIYIKNFYIFANMTHSKNSKIDIQNE